MARKQWKPLPEDKHWKELQEEAHRKPFKPLTKNQQIYADAIESSIITIVSGMAGTGKSYVACGVASGMLKEGRTKKIILTRPMVQCGEGLGFLKGSLEEKVSPYMRPLLDALQDFFSKSELEKRLEDRSIEMWPLELMRGASIKDSVIIADELQNTTRQQLHMLFTRFGHGAKIVAAGDVKQSDLSGPNAFADVTQLLRGKKEISIIRLTKEDCVRHPLVAWIDEQLSL